MVKPKSSSIKAFKVYFITAGLLLFVCFQLRAQNENEVARELRKVNGISEMLTYTFDLESGDSLKAELSLYDQNGNLLEDLRYDKEGKLSFKYLCEYNADGLLTRQTGSSKPESVSTILVYGYDANGNRTDYKQLSPDGKVLVHQVRKFNRRGQNTSLHNEVIKTGAYYLSQEYYYRKDGQFSSIKRFSPDGSLMATSEYEYDQHNRLLKIYELVGNHKRTMLTNRYDEKGQLVETKYVYLVKALVDGVHQPLEKVKTTQYRYDAEGKVTEELIFEDGQLSSKHRYFYKKFKG